MFRYYDIKISRILGINLLTIACMIFLGAGRLVFSEDKAQTKDIPHITVIPESWDFGKVTETKILTYNFKLKNTGNKTLIIKNVITSCGCTSAFLSKNKLGPGRLTDLKATVDTAKIKTSGKARKEIYIKSNDPNHPTKIITVSMELDIPPLPKVNLDKPTQTFVSSTIPQPPKMSSQELYSRLQRKEKIVILDVREKNEYVAKHIPQAVWFPKSKFDKQDPRLFKKLKKIRKESVVVAYCGAGHRSSYVAKKLREAGYNAYNLDGVSFWEKENLPLIRGPKLPPSEEPAIIHLEEAYENYYLLFKDVVWIDVRDTEDYKRGHVKGALGIPLSEIESRFTEISRDKEIVLYCEGTWDGGSCEASMSAGRILIKNGYKQGNIKVFEDGYGAWENAGYPVEEKS